VVVANLQRSRGRGQKYFVHVPHFYNHDHTLGSVQDYEPFGLRLKLDMSIVYVNPKLYTFITHNIWKHEYQLCYLRLWDKQVLLNAVIFIGVLVLSKIIFTANQDKWLSWAIFEHLKQPLKLHSKQNEEQNVTKVYSNEGLREEHLGHFATNWNSFCKKFDLLGSYANMSRITDIFINSSVLLLNL